MSLQIETSRIKPDIVVVQLSGNITLIPENQVSDPFVSGLLDHETKKVVFDLSGVEHMDSSGVQLMVQCSTAIRKAGGELRLACANTRLSRLLQITRLDSILSLYPSVAAACQGFTSEAQ